MQPLYCQTRAAVCSVRGRAVLPSLRQALRGSWDGQPGGGGGQGRRQCPGGLLKSRRRLPSYWAQTAGPSLGSCRLCRPAHRMSLTLLGSCSPRQISEDLSTEKLCMEAAPAGSGSWLKYIRVACSCNDQNLTMCQINEQVGLGLAHRPSEWLLGPRHPERWWGRGVPGRRGSRALPGPGLPRGRELRDTPWLFPGAFCWQPSYARLSLRLCSEVLSGGSAPPSGGALGAPTASRPACGGHWLPWLTTHLSPEPGGPDFSPWPQGRDASLLLPAPLGGQGPRSLGTLEPHSPCYFHATLGTQAPLALIVHGGRPG